MVHFLLFLILILQRNVSFAALNDNLEVKKIAITIDDVPMPSTKLFNGIDRTKRIITTLKNANVNRVGLFVLGENIFKDEGEKRLRMYDEAGHMIGNHTYSHPACRKLSSEDFIDDIYKCHKVIKKYNNFKYFFRYPYLDECKSDEQKLNVTNALNAMGYKNAYVTIITLDYYVNLLLQKALRNNQKINYERLKDLYIRTTFEYIELYSQSIKNILGYSPVHNLLLHENDINALYLEDIIRLLKKKRWEIVSPEEAFLDPNVHKILHKNKINQKV